MEQEMETGLETLTRLEERILETVAQLRTARTENAALRAERKQILERVEKLLAQIEALGSA